jgi:hypothetical protein
MYSIYDELAKEIELIALRPIRWAHAAAKA